MIHSNKLAELRTRAQRRGALSIEDLRDVLPVDHMSADDIASLLLQLEEAGVTVEIDDDLLGASRRRNATAPAAPTINLPGANAPGRDAKRQAPAPGLAQDAYAPQAHVEQAAPPSADAWRFIAAAAAVTAVVAAAFLFFVR
jgi:hypothetical protein